MARRIEIATLTVFESLSSSAWQWLQQELDHWTADGITASFWWRDDDAAEPSMPLENLLKLRNNTKVPLSLAVIPDRLKTGLRTLLANQPGVSILQHGYSHNSYAPQGVKKIELGGDRNLAQLESELKQGFNLLNETFSDRFIPVLVPPWNRIENDAIKLLPRIGFIGISTMKVRKNAQPVAGLLQVNAHLDPVNWRHNRGFIGVYPAIATLVQHLIARRIGFRDIDEPSGILTHHLVQNDAVWQFTETLFGVLSNHPAVSWLDASGIWQTENKTSPGKRDS